MRDLRERLPRESRGSPTHDAARGGLAVGLALLEHGPHDEPHLLGEIIGRLGAPVCGRKDVGDDLSVRRDRDAQREHSFRQRGLTSVDPRRILGISRSLERDTDSGLGAVTDDGHGEVAW